MPTIISENNLRVYLNEKINELDEVVVGKILSGSLDSDINNFGKETDVNFYDLGIPGYTGKPKTLNERKLSDADAGGWLSGGNAGAFGAGVGVNFHKILNRISGRTKKLKARVAIDAKDKCRQAIKEEYGGAIFETEEFTEDSKADYFYFCMDDENFKDICNRNDPTEILPFLKNKLIAYKVNLNSDKD
jgi:arginine utilization protein RocB